MMMMTRRAASAPLVALLCALLGCGDDDSTSGEPRGAAGASGQAGSTGQGGAGQGGSVGQSGSAGRDGGAVHDGSDDRAGHAGQFDASDATVADGADATPLVPAGRLVFGDAEGGGLRVLELETGQVIASFADVAVGASLYATETGRIVGIVEGSSNRVRFLDSGLDGDGDGGRESQPKILSFALQGEQHGAVTPIHFVSHHGYVTVHFDGKSDATNPASSIDAKNFVIAEKDLHAADPRPALILQTAPQHGVSIVTEQGHVLLSLPTTDASVSTSPNGFAFYDMQGASLQVIQDGADFAKSCWGLHGEATVGGTYLFGCHEKLDGGVMAISWDATAKRYISRKLPYPGYPQAPKRTSVLRAHPKSRFAVGQWGVYATTGSQYRGLVRIDPAAGEIREQDTLDLGAVYCDFDFERTHGERVLALARNGQIHAIDVQAWSGHKTHALFTPSEACPGRLVAGDGVVYVTSTAEGAIVEIDAQSLDVRRTFHVGGKPAGAALAGRW